MKLRAHSNERRREREEEIATLIQISTLPIVFVEWQAEPGSEPRPQPLGWWQRWWRRLP